ncbi:hypothetical protein EUX98_g800 [Antrodiella citrinella]|uniref:DNA polymerase beta n=1 Tax=Antrodiella citrinella TaxID=2447956 RepID=A0A4S4N2Y9_9APHY|nr:hypothetical protein EUX98_g800 [Antrodiella citrinella]
MSSLDQFFSEQADRMSIPDEDIDSYVSRITSVMRTRKPLYSSALSQDGSDQSSSAPPPQESPRKRRRIADSDCQVQVSGPSTSSNSSESVQKADASAVPAASVKRKTPEHNPDSRTNKRLKADHTEASHDGTVHAPTGPVKDNAKQSRAQRSKKVSLPSLPQTELGLEIKHAAGSGDGNTRSTVRVSSDVAGAVTKSTDVDAKMVLQHAPDGSLDTSRPPITEHSRKGQSQNIKLIKTGNSVTRVDTSNVTTPFNSAIPSSSKIGAIGPVNEESTKKANPRTQATTKKSSSKKKSKEKLLPEQYAEKIMLAMAEKDLSKRKPETMYLKDMRIFFWGGDYSKASESTMRKMDILVDRGATLLPTFQPDQATHIVCDHIVTKGSLLAAINLKSLADIPDHIPTLKWDWIRTRDGKGRMARLHDHAAFPDRIHFESPDGVLDLRLGPREKKRKAFLEAPSKSEDNTEHSKISEFTEDKVARSRIGSSLIRPSDVVIGKPGPSATKESKSTSEEDPLACFYEQARAELAAEGPRNVSEYDSDTDGEGVQGSSSMVATKHGGHEAVQKRKFMYACDRKGEQPSNEICPNQDVIDMLEKLKQIHDTKGTADDKWRVLSYNKAVRGLRTYPKRIGSVKEAMQINGVGEKTAQKIMEIINTGALQRIRYENTEDVAVVTLFQGIYGVGPSVAHKWYANGCRTLDDLKNGKFGIKLSTAQRIGLKFYDDINTRMPRAEAKEIFDLIKPIALEIDPKLFVEIMGSYRRGKADCGDIDIMITRPTDDGKTHVGVLKKLLGRCHERGIITEDLNIPENWSDLENMYRGLCRRDENSRRRRIDFLTVPYVHRGAALLYYTGDDIFNRSMRMKANRMGYSLNQKGLFANVIRNPSDRREKLDDGTIIASATEEEIFKKLG